MILWDEEVRRRIRPVLFTREAWETLGPRQRDLIRRQRMAIVEALGEEHHRRYHSSARFIALDVALHQPADAG